MREQSVLAIDSAMGACSAGVYNARSGAVSCASEVMTYGQAEALMPMVERLMGEAGLSYADLDLIVSTRGPGAFTGLRVGMSAVKALALALDIPVLGVGTTEILAAQFFKGRNLEDDQMLCVLVETRRTDFYVQCFDASGAALDEVKALELSEIERLCSGKRAVLIGDAAARFFEEIEECENGWSLDAGYGAPDSQAMIDFYFDNDTQTCGQHYKGLLPVYLKGANVSQPKRAMRTLK